jgi:tRNA pseudouridine38-40 synthase
MNEPTLAPKSGLVRLKIELSYDGTDFAGWAKQPDQRTVQGEIENALSKLIGINAETIVAGRTDAGVHALAQIIHVDVPDSFKEIDNLTYKLNRMLDGDIRITSVDIAPEHFHARYSALSRTYQYKIIDGLEVLPPLNRFDTAAWYRKIDEKLMNEACSMLLGSKDFKAFCKFREDQSTTRTLQEFSWRREGGFLYATVRADSFCYSMVRNLVGAAVCIGEGRYEKDWIVKVLEGKERVSDSYVFPANGLTLIRVEY